VQGKGDRWFLIRILPYRTIANVIDGVVITLSDITEHKESEKKLNQLNDALNSALSSSKNIIDTIPVPLLVLATDYKIISANRSFYKNFHLLPEDVIGKLVYEISGWDLPELRELSGKEFPGDILFEGYEINAEFSGKGRKKLILNARKIFNNGNGEDMILLAMDPK
jgi:two-component system CheB/CheR fusion protein